MFSDRIKVHLNFVAAFIGTCVNAEYACVITCIEKKHINATVFYRIFDVKKQCSVIVSRFTSISQLQLLELA